MQAFGLEDNYGLLAVDDPLEAERRDERNSAQAMRGPSLSNLPLNPPKPAGFNSEPEAQHGSRHRCIIDHRSGFAG